MSANRIDQRFRIVSIIIVLLVFFAVSAFIRKQNPQAAEKGICTVKGYLSDPDKSGTNVRNAPQGNIVRLLPLQTDPAFESGVYIHIKKSKSGWLLIDYVEGAERSLYENLWVYGGLVFVGTRNYGNYPFFLYSMPVKAKKFRLVEIRGERELPIIGCEGNWIYTTTKDDLGQTVSGWLEPDMQCPNAVTNCN